MKPNKILFSIIFAAVFIGLARFVALADSQQETIGAKVATATNACTGKYYAYVRMTNSAGSTWIQPTNPAVSFGILTDLSALPAPYSSSAAVEALGATNYLCASNSVTFPATNTGKYQLMILVTSPAPQLTNGQPLNVQIDWK